MKRKHLFSFFYLVTLVFAVSACDQIKTIKEYFTGSQTDESVEVEPVAAPQDAKGQVKPQEVKDQALGANEVARVGKWVLTNEEFQERLNAIKEAAPDFQQDDPKAKAMILEELLRQELIMQDAEKRGLAKDKDIQIAVDEFRRQLIVRQSLTDLVKDIKVTEEEIKSFYEQNREQLVEPGDWRIREIRVDDKETAEQIRNEIVAGADFAQIATQKSKAPSASNGGDIGFVKQPSFPEMGEALAGLKEGEVSPVFSGPDGFYIMTVVEKKPDQQLELNDITKDIEQAVLMQKQQEAIANHIKKLTENIKVEVNENLLK